ncbi:MAG: hypothetical protein AAFX93_10585 [Verrucomicrobiota bacterium]
MVRWNTVVVVFSCLLAGWTALLGSSGFLYLCVHEDGPLHVGGAHGDHCGDEHPCSNEPDCDDVDLDHEHPLATYGDGDCIDLLLDASDDDFTRYGSVSSLPKLLVNEHFQPDPFIAYQPVSDTWVIKPPGCGPPGVAYSHLPSVQKTVLRL